MIYIIDNPSVRILLFTLLNCFFLNNPYVLVSFFVLSAILPYNPLEVNENYYGHVFLFIWTIHIFRFSNRYRLNRLIVNPFLLITPVLIIFLKNVYISHAVSIIMAIISILLLQFVFFLKEFDYYLFKKYLFNIIFIAIIVPYVLYFTGIDMDVIVLTGYKGSQIVGGFARMGTEKLDATAIYFPSLLVLIYFLTNEYMGFSKYLCAILMLIPCIMSYSFGFILSFSVISLIYLYYNYSFKLLVLFLVLILAIVSNQKVIEFYRIYQESKEVLGSLDSRTEVWEFSAKEILQFPFLGSYVPIHLPEQYEFNGDYGSHNILLEIWRRAGVLGFIVFTIFFYLKPIFRNNYSNAFSTMSLALLLIYFTVLHFYSNKLALVMIIFICYESTIRSRALRN
jgi:hypothetical protein